MNGTIDLKRYVLLALIALSGCAQELPADWHVRNSEDAIAIAIKECEPFEPTKWKARLINTEWRVFGANAFYKVRIAAKDGATEGCAWFGR